MLQPLRQTFLSCYKISANITFLVDEILRSTLPSLNQWKLNSVQQFHRNPFRVKCEDPSTIFWSLRNFSIVQHGSSQFWKWVKQRFFCLPFCASTIMDLSQMVIASKIWNDFHQNWFHTYSNTSSRFSQIAIEKD